MTSGVHVPLVAVQYVFELVPRDELLPLRVRPVVQVLHGLFAESIAAFASSGA